MKRYILTIEYNPDTEEIEYISEEVDDDSIEDYGNIDVDDYFDEEMLEYMLDNYIVGKA